MTGLLGLAALSPAQAVVARSHFGAENAALLGSDFSDVVRIDIAGVGACTGSPTSETTILATRHCISPCGVGSFRVDIDRNGNGSLLDAGDRSIAGSCTREAPRLLTPEHMHDGTDAATLTPSSAAPAWASPVRLPSTVTVGAQVMVVGDGLRGIDTLTPGTAGTSRWAAETIVDVVGAAPTRPSSSNQIATDQAATSGRKACARFPEAGLRSSRIRPLELPAIGAAGHWLQPWLPKWRARTVSSLALSLDRAVCRRPTWSRWRGTGGGCPRAGPTGGFGAARSGRRVSAQEQLAPGGPATSPPDS